MTIPQPNHVGAKLGRAAIALMLPIALATTGLLSAQTPAPTRAPAQAPTTTSAPAQAGATERLPLKRVVLYKSGVGYFEHIGKVSGNQSVTIDFTSGQLDDVLKTLTTLDLDGGRVTGVSYNSENAIDRQLGALRLPLGQQATRAQFLSALRGAKLEVKDGATRVVGRLLSVERVERRGANNTVSQVDALSLVSDAGEMQTIALDPGVSVRVVEADLNAEVGRYLSLVASERDQDLRRMTIATTGTGSRDLFVSYVSEVPVWKATYRLVLSATASARKPMLEGWAIVDNTVGEDWENVDLSLVAGAPQSFIQHISRPYYVQRPVVPLPDRVLMSPQTHQSALGTSGAGAMSGTVTDSSGGVLPGVSVRVSRGNAAVANTMTDSGGRYRIENVAPGTFDVNFVLSNFRTVTRSSVDVSGGMETVLNATMDIGTMTEAITATAGGSARGGGGGRGGAAAPPAAAPARASTITGLPQSAISMSIDGVNVQDQTLKVENGFFSVQSAAVAGEMGDLFEYKLKEPVTIRKNQSALVPILSSDIGAEKVSLWNPTSNQGRPLRAVWITNTTGLTLDAGSVAIIEAQAFAGEGLLDPLKAGERRLLSYAMDIGLNVDAKGDSVPSQVTKVEVSHGVVIQQTEERQRRIYTVRNENTDPRVVVIEHPVRAGWKLGGTLTATETTAAWYRFRVEIAAKTTSMLTVDEVHPVETRFWVSSVSDDQVALLVRDKTITAAVEAALREVIKRKTDIAHLVNEIASRQTEIDAIGQDQARVRENMQALKGTSEEKQLLQRYVKQLDDQENRLAVLRKELQALTADRDKAQADLAKFIDGMSG